MENVNQNGGIVMNEKIKAWECRLGTNRGIRVGGRGVCPSDALVHLTVSGNTPQQPESVLRISFHAHVLELTGWKAGDKLETEISGDKAIVFRADTGRMLSRNGGAKGSKGSRLYLRYAFNPHALEGFPKGVAREVESSPGKMAFVLPASEV